MIAKPAVNCLVCGKTTLLADLKKHLAEHQTQTRCVFCGKVYDLQDYPSHYREHLESLKVIPCEGVGFVLED